MNKLIHRVGSSLYHRIVLSSYHRVVPYGVRASLQAASGLMTGYGHMRSARAWSCVDSEGNPIPWYTYPALEHLQQLDFSECSVFEFGSGNSSRFWAARAKTVVSVEDDKAWYAQLTPRPANLEVLLREDPEEYAGALQARPEKFDVIVIDGSHRRRCADRVEGKLRPGGMIVLDNSDWYPDTAERLRALDLIEVDMHGFGPINPYSWTTSLFFSRDFSIRHLGSRMPHYSQAALRQVADEPV